MRNLSPFKQALRFQERSLKKKLAQGRESSSEVAILRLFIEIMQVQLRDEPDRVASYHLLADLSNPAELIWQGDIQKIVDRRVNPRHANPVLYNRKLNDYLNFRKQLLHQTHRTVQIILRREVLIVRNNAHVKTVVKAIATEFMRSRERQEHDDDYLKLPIRLAFDRFLYQERRNLLVALRLAYRMPADITVINIPEKRPAYVDSIEFAIGIIPIVGNVVAGYEAYRGKDLFGFHLSDVERGVLAASVLLPIAGRLVKGGRAMYTASRMKQLYGEDAFKWSYSMAMGERMLDDAIGFGRLRNADEVVAAGKPMPKQLGKDLADTLLGIGIDDAVKATPKAIDPKFVTIFEELSKKLPKLSELDPIAIERVLAKGPNESHLKGQLLEEILENRIVKMLKETDGKAALGLAHIKESLEFFPGHLIRDVNGRQVTDGIIAKTVNQTLEIVGIFEAKAGKSAARELSQAATSRSKLSKGAEAELRAYAKDIFRELEERARLSGTQVTTTIDEIIKEIKLTELGGQVRRDIERLDMAEIFIGSKKIAIKVTPKTTKFFGVLPNDVKGETITKQLAENGLKNFEVWGMNISQKELNSAAKTLSQVIETVP